MLLLFTFMDYKAGILIALYWLLWHFCIFFYNQLMISTTKKLNDKYLEKFSIFFIPIPPLSKPITDQGAQLV